MDIPNEPTIGHIIGVMLSIANHQMEPHELHALVTDFKRALKLKFKTSPTRSLPFIAVFPDSPAELPEALRSHAYGTATLNTDFNTGNSIAAQPVPLRRSSAHLRQVVPNHNTFGIGPSQIQSNQLLQMLVSLATQQPNQPMLNNLRILRPGLQRSITPPFALTDATDSHESHNSLVATPERQIQGPSLHEQGTGSLIHEPSPATTTSPITHAPTQPPVSPLLTLPSLQPQPGAMSAVVLNAFQNRAADKKDKKEDEQPPKSKSTQAKSKAKANAKAKAKAKVKAKSLPAAKTATSKPATKRPPMPTADHSTTFYLQGKVHKSILKQSWRVLINKSDRVDKA